MPDEDKHIHGIELDDVRCYGDETSILDCVHAEWGNHNCDKTEAAGVFCTPKSIVRETTPQPPTTISTTTTTTTTTTTERPTTTTKMKRKTKSPHTVKLLPRPTNIPKHVLQEPEVLSFMRDQRELTMEVRGRHSEVEAEPEVSEPEVSEPEIDPEELEVEPEPEVGSEEDVDADTGSGKVAVTQVPEMEVTETLSGNATDPVLALILAKKKAKIQKGIDADKAKVKAFVDDMENEVDEKAYDNPHQPDPYPMRVVNGRSRSEGRVEVRIGGVWGLVCSDNWSLLEARVACRQAGLGHAKMAARGTYFGGETMPKIVAGLKCDGLEARLSHCYHEQIGDVTCPEMQYIAGVVCTWELPDLVPNNTLLETSTYLQDQPMSYLQCAMEEGCASSSAYELKKKYYNWSQQRRRLLRFSSSTWNYGTADFRPFIPKNAWEWHMCHMHYHSMEVFAVYDLLDLNHNRVAEGHKASFCLEDVDCLPGKLKRYECNGYSDQGISAGCADTYLHNIDCQWIDITDVSVGKYIFRVHINPYVKVAELDYSNNAATCDLDYNGYNVAVTNCAIGDGSHMPHNPTTIPPE